jgi:hypothetical protein
MILNANKIDLEVKLLLHPRFSDGPATKVTGIVARPYFTFLDILSPLPFFFNRYLKSITAVNLIGINWH